MQAEIVRILGGGDYTHDIRRAAMALSAGKLLALPTETVYGVAGTLTSPEARNALADLRQATGQKAFTIHIARRDDAVQYLAPLNDFAQRMMRKLWPGPVGLIFEVDESRRREVAAKLGAAPEDLYDGSSITLRCPDHPVFSDVVSQVKDAVALTAAGGSGQRVDDLPPQTLSRVEMVLDAGPTRFSKPSTLLRVKENSYELVRAGVYDERIIERLMRTTILFVCSGNTCRSPMAEAIAKRYLSQRMQVSADELQKKGIHVISAGSYAMPDARATPQAVEALKQKGIDMSRHRSRPLTVELIHQADVIYAMSRGHVQAVGALVPSAADKVFTLDPQQDIEDPIGGDISLYAQIADRLAMLIEKRLREKVVP